MEERERVRERKFARERDSGGEGGLTSFAGGERQARSEKNVSRGGFDVESKSFEVEVEERRGRLQVTIVERKGGISSWVRLGPVSLGIVFECLTLSIENARMVRWVREWKENGREHSLTRDFNRGGCFLRLGVADLERKRFSVFIPKGRGTKGGWVSMVELLRRLGCVERRIKLQKEDEPRSKPVMAKTYAEAITMASGKESSVARVEVTKEEMGRNLSKLEHCIVGSWNPNDVKGDKLRGWGTQLARIWRLKGNLGLAKMEKGKVLMEFEIQAEAEQAAKSGSVLVGGLSLQLEKWRPETGCRREGDRSSEAWVRVIGLPVSLWERGILRKIGDACGGFLAMDHQTEEMEELQWARLLVKRNGEVRPNEVEVWVEGSCFLITLWWEIRPIMKAPANGRKGKAVVMGTEVGGDEHARARERVTGGMEGLRLKDALLTVDGTWNQCSRSGQSSNPSQSEDGPSNEPITLGGLNLMGQARSPGWSKDPPPGLQSSGLVKSGPGKPMETPSLPQEVGLASQSPPSSFKAQVEKGLSVAECNPSSLRGPDAAISSFWVKDGQWGIQSNENQWGGISRTDCALLEEDARYGHVLSSSGLVAFEPSSYFLSSFGRASVEKSFDRSGDFDDSNEGDTRCIGTETSEQIEGERWDLAETSDDCREDNSKALCLARPLCQEESGWVEARWEESDLARFSQFLGFSTEGIEKEILEFMGKIRKRRERIHNKAMLEKSKFERELRRLECSVNYEGGRKKKCTVQGRGCQIMEVQ